MPQTLTRIQLERLSRDPETLFFRWRPEMDEPASEFYHIMIAPGGRCIRLRVGWRVDGVDAVLGPVEISRRFSRSQWVRVTGAAFRDMMNEEPPQDCALSDPRFKTNHKIGAPKGKLP